MSKHTPGPWFHSNSILWGTATTKPDGRGETVAIVGTPARFNMRAGEDVDEEIRANGRLVASAPDLLAVAEKFIGLEMDCGLANPPGPTCTDLDCMFCDLKREARAAIAAARGAA